MGHNDIISYLMPAVGFLIAYILNGVRSEVKEIKATVQSLERDLRDGIAHLDRRVTRMETLCGKRGECDD